MQIHFSGICLYSQICIYYLAYFNSLLYLSFYNLLSFYQTLRLWVWFLLISTFLVYLNLWNRAMVSSQWIFKLTPWVSLSQKKLQWTFWAVGPWASVQACLSGICLGEEGLCFARLCWGKSKKEVEESMDLECRKATMFDLWDAWQANYWCSSSFDKALGFFFWRIILPH